jgi:hypothetical protein
MPSVVSISSLSGLNEERFKILGHPYILSNNSLSSSNGPPPRTHPNLHPLQISSYSSQPQIIPSNDHLPPRSQTQTQNLGPYNPPFLPPSTCPVTHTTPDASLPNKTWQNNFEYALKALADSNRILADALALSMKSQPPKPAEPCSAPTQPAPLTAPTQNFKPAVVVFCLLFFLVFIAFIAIVWYIHNNKTETQACLQKILQAVSSSAARLQNNYPFACWR